MARELSSKQRKFIAAYNGNGTEAARQAGYSGDENALAVMANYLLRNPKIIQAIRERESSAVTGLIATREERQEFWTFVMNDPYASPRDKLKASELLGRSEADFTDNVKHDLTDSLAERISAARKRRQSKK